MNTLIMFKFNDDTSANVIVYDKNEADVRTAIKDVVRDIEKSLSKKIMRFSLSEFDTKVCRTCGSTDIYVDKSVEVSEATGKDYLVDIFPTDGFGKRLKKILEYRGMDPKDLALKLSLKTTVVRNWMEDDDNYSPRLATLIDIAKILNVQVADLVPEIEIEGEAKPGEDKKEEPEVKRKTVSSKKKAGHPKVSDIVNNKSIEDVLNNIDDMDPEVLTETFVKAIKGEV